jgi:hypothetical protein
MNGEKPKPLAEADYPEIEGMLSIYLQHATGKVRKLVFEVLGVLRAKQQRMTLGEHDERNMLHNIHGIAGGNPAIAVEMHVLRNIVERIFAKEEETDS